MSCSRVVTFYVSGNASAKSFDIIQYTAPLKPAQLKPWTPLSPNEAPSLQPWLDMMELEGLNLPEQLPTEPAKEVFFLLSNYRSGSDWISTMLGQHPHICSSNRTKGQRAELSFPMEAMSLYLQDYRLCSMQQGCSLNFVLRGVFDLVNDVDRSLGDHFIPHRCRSKYQNATDSIPLHYRERLCNFIQHLNGNVTKEAIIRKWAEAFVDEDKRFLGCSCPRATKIKGLKVMAGWIKKPYNPDNPDPK